MYVLKYTCHLRVKRWVPSTDIRGWPKSELHRISFHMLTEDKESPNAISDTLRIIVDMQMSILNFHFQEIFTTLGRWHYPRRCNPFRPFYDPTQLSHSLTCVPTFLDYHISIHYWYIYILVLLEIR